MTARIRSLTPTHRNELIIIGKIYLNTSDDRSRVDPGTIRLIDRVNNELVMDLKRFANIYPSDRGAKSLDDLNHYITSGSLPVYIGGTHSVLGIDPMLERAAHDLCHFITQADFNLSGELKTFHYQASRLEFFGHMMGYSKPIITQAISVLYSEIYLQACAYDYLGCFPDSQKIVLTATPYKLLG